MKGRPLTTLPRTPPGKQVPLQGSSRWGRISQGEPWAKLSWPVGPKTRPYPHPSSWQMSKLQARHFVPGYDRAVPPGQNTLDRRVRVPRPTRNWTTIAARGRVLPS
jgi:hypothetical protein